MQTEREVKFSLFTDGIVLPIENPNDYKRKPLVLINKFIKIAGYKINAQKNQLHFYKYAMNN